MKIIINIETGNDAFAGMNAQQISRWALTTAQKEIKERGPASSYAFNVRDINGNTIGSVTVAPT